MAAVPQNNGPTSPPASVQPGSLDHRRMSTPAAMQPGDLAGHQINTDGKPDLEYIRQTQSATFPHSSPNTYPPLWQDMGPFTTSLPPESQQMLAHAPGFDHNDPSYAMLMNGSDHFMSNPYYPWNDMQAGIKGMPVHPSAYQGMSATLAPAALEHAHDGASTANTHSTPTPGQTATSTAPSTSDNNTLPTAGLDFNFSQETKGLDFGGAVGMSREGSRIGAGLASGQVTPAGEGFWENFVWDDGADGHAEPPAGSQQESVGA